MKGGIWMKKESLFSIILLVLFILIGCAKEEVPVEPSISPDKIKVNVIVSNNVSESVLEDLKNKGLIVSLETGGNLVLTGEVNETEFDELRNNPNLDKVVEKKESSNQLTDNDIQNAIDKTRARENITVGPYIRPELLEKLNTEEYVPMYIRYRLEERESYQACVKLVFSKLTEENIKTEEISQFSIKGEITKEGVDKLRNVPCVLDIGWRHIR